MKNTLKNLSDTIASANDIFYSRNTNINTIMGIIDKSLRKQGMQADAITLDCTSLDKKIVFLLHDDTPSKINITLGNKNGSIYSSTEYALKDISEALIIEIMEANFIL